MGNKVINSEDFLTEYLKDKADWTGEKITDSDGFYKCENYGNDFYNIDAWIDSSRGFYMKMESCEVVNELVCAFYFPSTYEKFKILMDIFLGE